MKRLFILILCLLLSSIAACQPTPKREHVVGKTPIESMRPEPMTSGEPALTWLQETIPIDKGALSEIDFAAQLENMDTITCPIYPLTPVSFDEETVERLIQAFAPNTRILIGETPMTLQDVEREIERTLNNIDNVDTKDFSTEADKEQYLQEERAFLSEMQQLYFKLQHASVTIVDVGALIERDKVDFCLIDDSGQTVAQGEMTCGMEAGDPRASLFHIWRGSEQEVPMDLPRPDPAEVQPICEAFLRSAGVEEFSFNEIASSGEIIYTRSVGKLPYAAAYDITALQWRGYDDGELFFEPAWMEESIAFFCASGRVESVTWLSKSDIGEAIEEVSILPLSELKQRIINGLVYQWSMPLDEAERSHRIEVSRIQIGMKRVPAFGAVGRYQLIPACTVIGRFALKFRSPGDNTELILDANNESLWQEDVLLVLSAIDGSIIG